MLVRNTSKAHSATNDFPSHSEKIREVIAAQFPAKHTKIAFDATAQFSGDQRISSIEREHYNAALETLRHHQDELLNLSSIIKNLREEREILLNDLEKLKDAQQSGARMQLNHKAQAEEAKIELSILKRRYFEDIEDYKNKLRVSEERKMMYESKIKEYQKEFENLEQSVRTDFHRVKNREKELESQLELIKHDAESQINSRDQKILELKRKIDALEFNMENVMIKEKKSKDDKVQMEEKFDKVIRNLKGSIRLLEEDLAAERAVRRKIDEIKY